MAVLSNPAFWGSLGALLAALGLEMIPAQQLIEHIIAAIAAVSGIIGIIGSLRSAGHRLRYERTTPEQK